MLVAKIQHWAEILLKEVCPTYLIEATGITQQFDTNRRNKSL